MSGEGEAQVVSDFKSWLEKYEQGAVAVAAIHALTTLIKKSNAQTIMELEILLKNAQEQLLNVKYIGERSKMIQLSAACELFARHVTRTALDIGDFDQCKCTLIERGEKFAKQADLSRTVISRNALPFFTDGMAILVHGYSNVAMHCLKSAAESGLRFKVIVSEGQPERDGYKAARVLSEAGIPVEVVLDTSVGFVMSEVDMVLTGAAGVCESGGIVNKIGTYQVSVLAMAAKKPFYVAAESYKFCRLFPLSHSDIPDAEKEPVPSEIEGVNLRLPASDLTPPQNITLLLTDIGVLTPSAVSDELIKLYY
uniref:Translation initiation factor eIF2B subunit alpha n=1 Tax=Hemiselmis tepida TaxID=464990 RepID=A0A7S0YTC8_9CRYP|mmetsp:Transcript_25193/g.63859  ORF Transcript_25193/g.63859 Transcript_25193/m.63859 type:complete len:310 (+) Transcript_25193:52-981(+)|eukprot:CAMPEP_0174931982 /NCGR_PEP_ID=MMETSP1355-20121228/35462_1 /TAXON_ID=464990 /ORGANISM="Hemiselmis tepida, Strain CCMP443" /LENGTH=309 /DNA_ID=CAMNT_0016178379 /DNA_START=41 /DNA_END=970 /DNA_ORIENTATION=-